MEPSAVTIQESSEIAPTWAMLVGQHDDAGAHHVHGDDERELHHVHLLGLHGAPPVGVELDAVIDPILVDAWTYRFKQ